MLKFLVEEQTNGTYIITFVFPENTITKTCLNLETLAQYLLMIKSSVPVIKMEVA